VAADGLVGVKDVAQHLGCSRNYVYELVELKALPVYKIGNRFRFRITEVDEWLGVQRTAENAKEVSDGTHTSG